MKRTFYIIDEYEEIENYSGPQVILSVLSCETQHRQMLVLQPKDCGIWASEQDGLESISEKIPLGKQVCYGNENEGCFVMKP